MNNNKREFKRNQFAREGFIDQLKDESTVWDVIVIGGGATGLGVAVDAASRGYRTLLLEQADFAKGTSSRSTKLVHGGVRYLAQGDLGMVYEALFERGILLKNVPHLVRMQAFVIPCYRIWDKLKYGFGLKLYDWMAGKLRFHKTSVLSKEETQALLPELQQKGLKGGVKYYDGQFDDARLALNLAQTSAEQGGVLLNYMKVSGLLKDELGKVCGVRAEDLEAKQDYLLKAKAVVNATGVFVDEILRMDAPAHQPLVKFSQGVHLVLDRSFLNDDHALMIPETPDGRVLFVVPWHDHLIVGTTDTPVEQNSIEPVALQKEINFILETVEQYLVRKPSKKDILSIFAGLRPLAAPDQEKSTTKDISRSHKLVTAASGLVTITGGKWTTYRKMAEDAVEEVIKVAGLKNTPCITTELPVHGAFKATADHLSIYGSDAALIRELINFRPELNEQLHESLPHTKAEVVWAVQREMARNIEDVLARRLRILFLNAKIAIEVAPITAQLIAEELNYDEAWMQKELKEFTILAQQYLPELGKSRHVLLDS